jgi:CubicO group peptidase (beta-lactamase class C family)
MTFGFLVGEVVRRISGQSPGQFFAAEVAEPMKADFYIGLPDSELGRCSELQGVRPSEDEQAAIALAYANAHPAAAAALINPALTGDEGNSAAWRQAELPAANGHGTAAALATIFGTLADRSQRLISDRMLQAARTGNGRYTDLVLGIPLEFGLGYGLSGAEGHFGASPASFGHDGFGGSAVGADPDQGVAFAYVMNRMGLNLVDDPRKTALVRAIYRSISGA